MPEPKRTADGPLSYTHLQSNVKHRPRSFFISSRHVQIRRRRLTSSLTSVPRPVRRRRGEHCYLRPQASAVFCQVCEIENHPRRVCVAVGGTCDREDGMKVCFLFWSCWKPIHPNFGRSKNGNENGLLDAQERGIWPRCTHVFTIKHVCFWRVFAGTGRTWNLHTERPLSESNPWPPSCEARCVCVFSHTNPLRNVPLNSVSNAFKYSAGCETADSPRLWKATDRNRRNYTGLIISHALKWDLLLWAFFFQLSDSMSFEMCSLCTKCSQPW